MTEYHKILELLRIAKIASPRGEQAMIEASEHCINMALELQQDAQDRVNSK